jgi:ribonuclease D
LKTARQAVAEISEQLAIPVENLLTPEMLRRVAWSPPEPITAGTVADALAKLSARPWQIDATAQAIAAAFVESAQTPSEAPKTES